MFTAFLSPAEASLARAAGAEIFGGSLYRPEGGSVSAGCSGGVCAFGGTEDCERVMVRYGDPDELGYEEPFPIAVLRIEPVNERFADDLTHRDFLGALMNLQIARDVIGDIVVREKTAYVFCERAIAAFLSEHLDRIRHTSVRAAVTEEVPEDAKPVRETVSVNVSSERIDGVVSHLFGLARAKAKNLFAAGQVFVNGWACENESRPLREGDVVSVRGYGKFRYAGLMRETKKGRMVVRAEMYR